MKYCINQCSNVRLILSRNVSIIWLTFVIWLINVLFRITRILISAKRSLESILIIVLILFGQEFCGHSDLAEGAAFHIWHPWYCPNAFDCSFISLVMLLNLICILVGCFRKQSSVRLFCCTLPGSQFHSRRSFLNNLAIFLYSFNISVSVNVLWCLFTAQSWYDCTEIFSIQNDLIP